MVATPVLRTSTFLATCLLMGCAIDGPQHLNPYTTPAVPAWERSAGRVMSASEVPVGNNFSWTEVVGLERGLLVGPVMAPHP